MRSLDARCPSKLTVLLYQDFFHDMFSIASEEQVDNVYWDANGMKKCYQGGEIHSQW
jgi:hypothetical protein